MNFLNNKRLNKWLLSLSLMIGFLIFDVIYLYIGIDFNTISFVNLQGKLNEANYNLKKILSKEFTKCLCYLYFP